MVAEVGIQATAAMGGGEPGAGESRLGQGRPPHTANSRPRWVVLGRLQSEAQCLEHKAFVVSTGRLIRRLVAFAWPWRQKSPGNAPAGSNRDIHLPVVARETALHLDVIGLLHLLGLSYGSQIGFVRLEILVCELNGLAFPLETKRVSGKQITIVGILDAFPRICQQ